MSPIGAMAPQTKMRARTLLRKTAKRFRGRVPPSRECRQAPHRVLSKTQLPARARKLGQTPVSPWATALLMTKSAPPIALPHRKVLVRRRVASLRPTHKLPIPSRARLELGSPRVIFPTPGIGMRRRFPTKLSMVSLARCLLEHGFLRATPQALGRGTLRCFPMHTKKVSRSSFLLSRGRLKRDKPKMPQEQTRCHSAACAT